jgi:hypothetical protein
VKLIIKLKCQQSKVQERMLVDETIPTLVQREVKNYPLEFTIETTGQYL